MWQTSLLSGRLSELNLQCQNPLQQFNMLLLCFSTPPLLFLQGWQFDSFPPKPQNDELKGKVGIRLAPCRQQQVSLRCDDSLVLTASCRRPEDSAWWGCGWLDVALFQHQVCASTLVLLWINRWWSATTREPWRTKIAFHQNSTRGAALPRACDCSC